MAKPHIGTDVLRRVVKNMRAAIVELGGEIRFHTKLCGIEKKDGALTVLRCETPEGVEELLCDTLVLAIGHSARDTFAMLHGIGLQMSQKPFSMGVRIEHLQKQIDRAQYGKFAGNAALGAADYKLSHRLADGRGVYTFCMCPGGRVVAAASEPGMVVTNGMSDHARDGANANAALLCDVRPAILKASIRLQAWSSSVNGNGRHLSRAAEIIRPRLTSLARFWRTRLRQTLAK